MRVHPATHHASCMVDMLTRASVSRSKTIVRLPEPWLRRPRLLSRVSRVTGGQTMLVAALAGSGKTTLLADWFMNERAVDGGWVTFDRHDNERGRLACACAAALGLDDLADATNEPDMEVIDALFDAIDRHG